MKMKKNVKGACVAGTIFLAVFAAWTVLVQTIDVRAVGPNGSLVGFASLNTHFNRLTGVSMALYNITDWLGLVPLCVCLYFACLGAVQMFKRKSIFKTDRDIIILGIYYTIVILCYLVFEKVPINFRPILINGVLEASYPSSATLLMLCVMPTLDEQVKRRVKNGTVRKITRILTAAFSLFTVIARTASGVHWLSDILGAVFLSAGLFYIYLAVVRRVCAD